MLTALMLGKTQGSAEAPYIFLWLVQSVLVKYIQAGTDIKNVLYLNL